VAGGHLGRTSGWQAPNAKRKRPVFDATALALAANIRCECRLTEKGERCNDQEPHLLTRPEKARLARRTQGRITPFSGYSATLSGDLFRFCGFCGAAPFLYCLLCQGFVTADSFAVSPKVVRQTPVGKAVVPVGEVSMPRQRHFGGSNYPKLDKLRRIRES
jgi:hypothetical protein